MYYYECQGGGSPDRSLPTLFGCALIYIYIYLSFYFVVIFKRYQGALCNLSTNFRNGIFIRFTGKKLAQFNSIYSFSIYYLNTIFDARYIETKEGENVCDKCCLRFWNRLQVFKLIFVLSHKKFTLNLV